MCIRRRSCQPLKYEDDNNPVILFYFICRLYSTTYALQFPNISSYSQNNDPSTTNQMITILYFSSPSLQFQIIQYVLCVFFPSQPLQTNTNSREARHMLHPHQFSIECIVSMVIMVIHDTSPLQIRGVIYPLLAPFPDSS